MSNKLKMLLLSFLLVCACAFCQEQPGLHIFYKQNGDCFVLIGSGTARGVYALNNLTGGDTINMYDPFLAYGLSAGQWWTGTANETSPSFIEKRLYTFSGTDNPGAPLDGVEVKRRVIARGDYGVYGEDPPYIVHGAHSKPNDSPTGLGNHTHWDYCKSLDNFFTPSDIPCTEVPRSAGKDKQGYDLYWVTSGVDWYHARDYNVWSDYTYYNWSGIPGRNTSGGGWCHRVVKEFLTEYTRDLKLTAKNINNKNSPSTDFVEDVARVTTETKGRATTLGECVDGCIRAQPNVELPGIPEPVLSLAYSSQVQRSYLYNRPYGEPDYTLLGQVPGDVLVGTGTCLTCNFLGLSTKDNTSNYVYLLGSKVINSWMEAANCPTSMYIENPEDLACLAVSDQWWQTGGIVYAYDSKKAKIYSFVRVEGGKSGFPDEIDVHFDGIKPDKIGADGFGNLYVLKTELEPKDTSNFGKDGTEVEKHKIFSFNGKDHFVAIYRQKVYKAVYKRPYGLDSDFSRLNNRILIGVNEYEREFITDDNDIDSKKIWTTNLLRTKYDGDGNNIRTEIAVINVPTPPEPTNVNAIVDCNGPLEQDEYKRLIKAEPDNEDGSYSSTRNIFFAVENAPEYDANGVNLTTSTEDKDLDGAGGCFPNTIKESSVVYHWKIVKTKDRFGNPIKPTDDEYVVLDTIGDSVFFFPSMLEGEFDVGVKVEYRYYDYTKLKVGALASEKETCLYPKPPADALVATAKPDNKAREGYSWEHIRQTWREPPESIDGKGIIMSSMDYEDESGYKPVLSDDDSSLKKTSFVMDGASLCQAVNNNKKPYYISDIKWGLKLRETQANLKKGLDRISIVQAEEPPNPNDPDMIPDTLKWINDFQVAWKADLVRGDETIWSKTLTVENFNLTQEQLRTLLPMPSDPLKYVIKASVYREYSYKVYVRIPLRQDADGNWIYKTTQGMAAATVSITGDAEICVTDNIGPSIYQYNAEENATDKIVPGYKLVYANSAGKEDKNTVFIKASTGESIADCPNKNTYVAFYVCDNNPMSNYSGPVAVTTNTRDFYHMLGTDALRASFNKDARKAILHYDTANGVKSKTGTDTYFIPIVVDNEAELKSVGLVPSTALSYVKYLIPAKFMDEFNDGKMEEGKITDKAKLPFNYANNTNGYTNYRFGLSWLESCNDSTYNLLDNKNEVIGSAKGNYFVGNVVIKDNDRPNIFITGFQDRYPDMGKQFRVPAIAVDNKYDNLFETDPKEGFVSIKNTDKWFLTVDDESNGPEKWYNEGTFGGDINNSFKFINADNALLTIFRDQMTDEKSNETKDCRLLTDVPVLFRYVMIDNSGTPKCTSFILKDYDNNTQLANGKQDEAIQYIFRKAGRYYVELQVEDDAKDWPDNTNAIDNPTNATAAPLKRTLRAYFEVLDSKFNYRVLERGVNEK